MAAGDRGRMRGGVRCVTLSLFLCAVAALIGLAVSHPRPASAQAPDEAFWLPADTEIQIGDPFLLPPDSDVGPPFDSPPDDGGIPMGGRAPVIVNVIFPTPPYNYCPLIVPRTKPETGTPSKRLWARGDPDGGT
jgi:hypothetical protein